MSFEYTMMQYKTQELLQEAEQRRLVREAQAANDAVSSMAANLEKIRLQLVERYTRKPQLPLAPVCVEPCCSPS